MTTITAMLDDLLGTPDLSIGEAIARHVTDDYRQRTDGSWDSRDGFAAQMTHLRSIVASIRIEVLEELTDGRTYADRHRVHLVKRDGSAVTQEVYLFGELAHDGRFRRIEEVTMMLAGSESDRGIGSAR